MKNLTLLLITVLIFSCDSPAQHTDATPAKFEVDIQKPGVQILDVRTASEFQAGHIKNALQADWFNTSQFKDRVQYLDKSKPVFVYCATGGRSSKAAKWLASNGFAVTENLSGGFTQWKLENRPFEAAGEVPQLTINDYNNYISSANIVLIDFGAQWCPPCKKMEPVLAQLQAEEKDVKLVKVDGGINTDIMQELGVAALPTFIMYSNGKETWRKQGLVTMEEFKTQIQQTK